MKKTRSEYVRYTKTIARYMEQWLKKQINLASHLDSFELKRLSIDWSIKRRCSRGGWYKSVGGPGISIAMHTTCKSTNGQVLRWYEYSSFDNNPVIGGFYYTDPCYALQGIVAHEMAHAAQYHCYYTTNQKRDKPHGKLFKYYYQALREEFVNPIIENQDILLEQRNKNIQDIKRAA